jgi:hypothetical protein
LSDEAEKAWRRQQADERTAKRNSVERIVARAFISDFTEGAKGNHRRKG